MSLFDKKPNRTYLDYAAATPVHPEVLAVMMPYFTEHFANASAIHQEGVAARGVVDDARLELARVLKIRPEGVLFTGSGTESNNLAILGSVYARHKAGVAYTDMEVISTRIEHPSVMNVLSHLTSLGVMVRYIAVNEEGAIVPQSLQEALSLKTVVVSFAYVNSEIGVVQEVGKLARIVRAFETAHSARIYVHIDAAQAPLWLPCALDQLHVDILTLDAGKCFGPKGVGVVAMRHGVTLSPVLFGGPQEQGIRPATENVPGIVGAVAAVVRAQTDYQARAEKVTAVRDAGIARLEQISGVVLNGARTGRVANNINISIPGIDSEFAVIVLDEAGIACSTKSACSGAGGGGSTIVREISQDAARATSTIRLTLSETSTLAEIEKVATVLEQHITTNAYLIKS